MWAFQISVHEFTKFVQAQEEALWKFQCTQCSFEAIESPSPRIHMRVHNGTKPYHCNLCDSSFRRKTHPKSHAMTHTSKRTPVCIHQPHWRCDEVQKFSSEKWFPHYRGAAHCGQYNSESKVWGEKNYLVDDLFMKKEINWAQFSNTERQTH